MGDVRRVLAIAPGNLQDLQTCRLTLEVCENVHLHWRNLRVEASLTDAFELLTLARGAADELLRRLEHKVVHLPLETICPFNSTHRRSDSGRGWVCGVGNDGDTLAHEQGVDFWKAAMLSGREPWPIAVRPWYIGGYERPCDVLPRNFFQRLDGFKRYVAHVELGRATIPAFVLAQNVRGCQHDMPHPFRFAGDDLTEFFAADLFGNLGQVALAAAAPEFQRANANSVELLQDDTIHVHVGDVRLEFRRRSFERFASLVTEAAAAMTQIPHGSPVDGPCAGR